MEQRRRVFMDLEFTGLHQRTTPISIGLISGDDSFYAEFSDFDTRQLNDWLHDNVIRQTAIFKSGVGLYRVKEECFIENDGKQWTVTGANDYIARKLAEWLKSLVGKGEKVEIWSDCLAYDWVVFCQLYKGAFQIPECVYYIPFDIAPLFMVIGIDPDVSREEFAFDGNVPAEAQKHNALWDAMVIQRCFDKIETTLGLMNALVM